MRNMTPAAGRAIRKVVAAICSIDDDQMTFQTQEGDGHQDVSIVVTMKGGQRVEIDIRAIRPSAFL